MRFSLLVCLFALWLNVDVSFSQTAIRYSAVIHVDNNVQVNGDPEEANYGNVVRFSCKSNTEILYGSSEIYCDENGEWSGPAPKCKAIKCTVPIIENGRVTGGDREYNEHEILHFDCNYKYTRTEERPSKCTRVGLRAEWSPTPVCESTKCKLKLPPLQGTSYEPAYRNVFSPGETLTVTCGQKYWIHTNSETSVVTTCNDEGEWSVRPICQEVICSNPRDRYVDYWGAYWQRVTLGDTSTYRCRSGYKSTDGSNLARCTRDGWQPNPLCQAAVACGPPPVIANGDIKSTPKSQYSHNESVEFMCMMFYTMEGEPYTTCINGEWTGQLRCLQPCVVNENDLRQHNITVKSPDNKYFTHDEIIEFRCARGMPVGTVAMRQRCNSGVILLPTCN